MVNRNVSGGSRPMSSSGGAAQEPSGGELGHVPAVTPEPSLQVGGASRRALRACSLRHALAPLQYLLP